MSRVLLGNALEIGCDQISRIVTTAGFLRIWEVPQAQFQPDALKPTSSSLLAIPSAHSNLKHNNMLFPFSSRRALSLRNPSLNLRPHPRRTIRRKLLDKPRPLPHLLQKLFKRMHSQAIQQPIDQHIESNLSVVVAHRPDQVEQLVRPQASQTPSADFMSERV